jgi:hypothetical protein
VIDQFWECAPDLLRRLRGRGVNRQQATVQLARDGTLAGLIATLEEHGVGVTKDES